MARYNVDFKSFKTGDWYTKTDTDSYASAKSVALTLEGYGRACRVIDTETDEVLFEYDENENIAKEYRDI